MDYIVINKKKIQDRIDELNKYVENYEPFRDDYLILNKWEEELETLKDILSKSTDLQPILEDVFNKGKDKEWNNYINNFKLDI